MKVTTSIKWPKKTDNPFFVKAVDSRSPTWASIQWLDSLNVDDSFLAETFKEAADKIIIELSRGESFGHPDKFFIPIAYMYRHCLELKLKQIIRLGICLDLIKKSKVQDSLHEHDLYKLWYHAKSTIVAFWPDGPKDELDATESIILKFHYIDKSGQSLRYTRDKNGKKSLGKFPASVDLFHFKNVFEGLFNLLDGCEMGLEDARDTQRQMFQDYGP